MNKGLNSDGTKRGDLDLYVVYYGKHKQRYQHMIPVNRIVGPRYHIKLRLSELELISWFDYELYRILPDGNELLTDGFSEEELIKMMLNKKKRY